MNKISSIKIIKDITKENLERYVSRAIYDLVHDKTRIINRYGFINYLQMDGDRIFLQRSFPTNKLIANYQTNYYNVNLIGTVNNDIFSYIEKSRLESIDEFDLETIQNLNIESKILTLEKIFRDNQIEAIENNNIITIMDYYRKYFFLIKYPKDAIQELIKNHNRKKTGKRTDRITKSDEIDDINDFFDELQNDDQSNDVLVHIMNSINKSDEAYGEQKRLTNITGTIRILKNINDDSEDSELGNIQWTDVDKYEQWVISRYIKYIKQKRKEAKIGNLEIYGIETRDKKDNVKFLIVDKSKENKSKTKNDTRYKLSGKACMSFSMDDQIDILYRLGEQVGHTLPADSKLDFETIDKDDFFQAWYDSGNNKSDMCDVIKEKLSENKMIIED